MEEVKLFIKKERPLILLFHEKKMGEKEILQNQYTIWNGRGILPVSIRGASDGISTLWLQSMIILLDYRSLSHWLATHFLHISSNQVCSLVNIYILVQYIEKNRIGIP